MCSGRGRNSARELALGQLACRSGRVHMLHMQAEQCSKKTRVEWSTLECCWPVAEGLRTAKSPPEDVKPLRLSGVPCARARS